MKNQTLNSFINPKQQFPRGTLPQDNFGVSHINNMPQMSSYRDNVSLLNSPYFATGNTSIFSEKNIRPVTRIPDTKIIKPPSEHPSKSQSIIDSGDFKKEFSSHRIDNKYGLEVRKMDRTPRNSHTETDARTIANRPKLSVLPPPEQPQIIEKRSIDFRQISYPEFTQTFTHNSIGTPQKVIVVGNNQQILTKNNFSTQNLVTNPHSQSNMFFQNAIVPKPSIKVEKEIIVHEFNDHRRDGSTEDISNRVRKVLQIAPEVIEIEIENVGVYEGTIRNNFMHGCGRLFDSKRRLFYEGEFAENNFEGLGVQYNFPEETVQVVSIGSGMTLPTAWIQFEGLFHNGLKTGLGTLLFADRSRFIGDFENGKANGYGRYIRGNEMIRGFWKNNTHIQN